MKYFENSESVKTSDLIGKPIKIRSIVLDDTGKGMYAVILAENEGKLYSFTCSAKIIIGAFMKILKNFNMQVIYKMEIIFPTSWDIVLIQKTSKEGKNYIDYTDVI